MISAMCDCTAGFTIKNQESRIKNSEGEPATQLEQSTLENGAARVRVANRPEPLRPVRAVHVQNRAVVERIVDVDIRFQTGLLSDPEQLRQPQIDLVAPRLVTRARDDQRHLRRGRADGRSAAIGEISTE